MAGMFGKRKQTAALEAEISAREAENRRLNAQMPDYARLKVENTALRLQLDFWHNHSKELENHVHLYQRLYFEALQAVRNSNSEVPVDFVQMTKDARAAVDIAVRNETGISSLIMAVALTSSNQKEVVSALIPSLRPLLDQLDSLPSKPPAQAIGAPGLAIGSHEQPAQATGERTQFQRSLSKPS